MSVGDAQEDALVEPCHGPRCLGPSLHGRLFPWDENEINLAFLQWCRRFELDSYVADCPADATDAKRLGQVILKSR